MEEALVNSSTSSSRSPWTILVAGLLLVALYEGLLRTGKVEPGHGVGQFQRNVVMSESYVFGGQPKGDVVVVGSSLTENLLTALPDDLDSRIKRLAMGGESSLTGMALVDDAPQDVRRSLVEVSHAMNVAKDPKITDMTEARITSKAVKNIWALRQEYQPANVLSRYLAKSTGGAKTEAMHGALPEQIRGPILADVAKLFSVPPTPAESKEFQRNLEQLRDEIDTANSKGIQCELFWPPIDSTIMHSRRESAFFAMAQAVLPPTRYKWIQVDYSGPTRTNDGYHLIADDATAYATALASAAGIQKKE